MSLGLTGVSGAFENASEAAMHDEHTAMYCGGPDYGYWTCSCGQSYGHDRDILETHIQDVMFAAEEPTFVTLGDETTEDALAFINDPNGRLKAVLTPQVAR